MKSKITAVAVSAVSVAAGLAIGLSASASASTAPVRHHAVCAQSGATLVSPATRHVVKSGVSLDRWTKNHGTQVASTLSYTLNCGGGHWQRAFAKYLNTGQLHKPLPAGTVLWAFPYKPFRG